NWRQAAATFPPTIPPLPLSSPNPKPLPLSPRTRTPEPSPSLPPQSPNTRLDPEGSPAMEAFGGFFVDEKAARVENIFLEFLK
uniref:Uncharacterized protein n=1 Tax=Aegilops tauschii subsp. strangulata TaxID=200361 RepID=A0A452Y7A7_AEGTS